MHVGGFAADSELVEALGERLDGRPIAQLRRRPYRYATSAPLEEVRVMTDAGAEVTLIFKDLSRERMLDDARTTKPQFLHDPRREVETYRRILGPAGIGPRCYAAVADGGRRRHWLLLEKVAGVELWQVGEFTVWEDVARWLGAFHARFADRLDEVRAANPHLLEHSDTWFAAWCDRARAALEGAGDPRASALARALKRYDAVVEGLASLPRTFVHGELYPSNVLVVRRTRPAGVYPVDWEMAAIGPGLIDLAALVGGWGAPEGRRLQSAYLLALGEAGGARLDEARLSEGLARCRLHLALQWLGWSHDWSPPAEHAHDWLAAALAAAEDLGLR